MYGTHQKNSTFLFKKKILPYATWGILQKEPLVEGGARIPPSMPLQGMLSASGPASNWKRRLSAPGGPWAPDGFMDRPSAVPSSLTG